jgi:hypothetical protein
LPAQRRAPFAQTPTQAPPEQVWFEQATALPHWPMMSQVCTPLPEHLVAPGTQTPWHDAVVLLGTQPKGQSEGGPQVPFAEQVSTPWVRPPSSPVAHCLVPGAQTPVHDAVLPVPVTQAALPQSTGWP